MKLSELCNLDPERSFFDLFLYYEPGRQNIQPHFFGMVERILTKDEWAQVAQLVDAWYATITDEEIAQHNAGLDHTKPKCSRVKSDNAPARQRNGFIYILKGDKYYKIGQAVDVDDRLKQFSPKLPFPTEIVHTFAVDDMHAAEKELHEHFADKRGNGEWFELDPSDVEYIKSLAIEDGS